MVGRAIDVFQAVPVAMGGHANDQNILTGTAVSIERRVERSAEDKAKKLIAFVRCVQLSVNFFVSGYFAKR